MYSQVSKTKRKPSPPQSNTMMKQTVRSFRRTVLFAGSLPLAYSASAQLSKYNERSNESKSNRKIVDDNNKMHHHEPVESMIEQKKRDLWQQTEDRLFNKLLSLALDTTNEFKWNNIENSCSDSDDNKEQKTRSKKHQYTFYKLDNDKENNLVNNDESLTQFVKSECIVNNFSPNEYYKFLENANNFCEWEVKHVEPCTKTDNLKMIDKDHSILYGVYKALPDSFYAYFNLVSPRDFQYILARKYIQNDNDKEICINFMYSIDNKHKLYMKEVDNTDCVRSEFMGMYIVQKMDDNKSKLITILCGDAKGWIPSWLNNQISLHTVQMIAKFENSIPWMKSILNGTEQSKLG